MGVAELGRRELVPAIWLPDPAVRAERERARFRLHLVRHRVALKNRVHATLVTFGVPCPVSDLFGQRGRRLLERLAVPDPWRSDVIAAVALIDEIDTPDGPKLRWTAGTSLPPDLIRAPTRRWRDERRSQPDRARGP